jgi:hypothetical protein
LLQIALLGLLLLAKILANSTEFVGNTSPRASTGAEPGTREQAGDETCDKREPLK